MDISTDEENVFLYALDTGQGWRLGKNTHLLLRDGVYKVVSAQPVQIISDATRTYAEVTSNDGEVFPDPRPKMYEDLGRTRISTAQAFFAIVSDPSARSKSG